MDIDLVKLGKLIEKCKDAGVSELSLGEGVCVKFNSVEAVPVVEYKDTQTTPVEDLPDEVKQAIEKNEREIDEEMLHLVDPVAWQESMLDPEGEHGVATGGDEERELSHG